MIKGPKLRLKAVAPSMAQKTLRELKNIYYQHLSLVFIFSRLVYSRNKSINQYVKVINAEISLNLDY